MKNKIIIAIILILLFIPRAFAEVSINAKVDKTKINTDEAVTYKVTIISSERNIPAPQIPKFKSFNMVSQSQSSTASFTKSKINIVIVYTFILAPADIGRFKIEPSIIKIKDKVYTTDSFEIEVVLGKAKPVPKPEKKPSLPEELLPEREQPQITL